jgi:phospholipid/cholesterol/gamma-HCH transport system substrate-binding protein
MSNRHVIVGMFVLIGLTLFTVGIFLVGNRHGAFARHVEFYTEFKDLSGLTIGSKVKVAGMDAGQVVGVAVPDDPSSRFRIKLQINERLRGLVRTDSVATIATEGVVGGTYLLVRSGSPEAQAAPPLATLPSRERVEMSMLLDRGLVLLKDADTNVNQIGTKLDGTLDGVKTTVANVNDVVLGLKQGRGPAGMMLRDETVASNIRQSVTNVKQATVDVRQASGRVDAMTADIRSRGVTQKVDETISSAKEAAARIDDSAKQVHQTVTTATRPDKQGVDAGTNARESLSNLNAASANMTEDTEALKHNFILRGYFRRRGYYSLSNLSPDTYRKDRIFTNPANERVWFSATELFTMDSGKSEVLSTDGKKLLDAALDKFGGSVFDRPIVIEGYSNRADPPNSPPADPLSSSRHRAILVRQYLENRFQLFPSNLGIVAMSGSPPDGLGHSEWDGICLVFLRPQH